MKDLAGKVAVVTGAASGIGLALCETFAAEGMALVMADVEKDALYAVSARLGDGGTEVLPIICDVSLPDAVDDLARACFDRFGGAHVLCNNAGVASGGLAWEQTQAMWEWVVGVNLWGVIHGVRAFAPRMIAQGEGHVVNTASMAGLVPLPLSSPYTVTKHAVVGLSEALYWEMKMTGQPVGVSVLCPGWVNTKIGEADRNWPDRLGPSPSEGSYAGIGGGEPEGGGAPDGAQAGDGGAGARSMMQAILAQGMDPHDVAARVLDAVHTDTFWILTHPEMGKAVLDRYTNCVEGRNPTFGFGGLIPGVD